MISCKVSFFASHVCGGLYEQELNMLLEKLFETSGVIHPFIVTALFHIAKIIMMDTFVS